MEFKEHRIQDILVPVYVPGDNGELKLEVGTGSLKGGQLVIKFNDRLPAQAIQRMLADEILFAVTLVPVQAVVDPGAEDNQEDNKEKNDE